MSSGTQPNDTCLTTLQLKKLLSFANRGLACDTLTVYYDNEITVLDSIIIQKDNQILLSQELIEHQSKQINKQKRREKWLFVGLGAFLLLTLGVLLFKN
jgi:hypothetical protein